MADKLDRLLERDAALALDDAGFTARVLRALPPRAVAPHAWWYPVLLLGATALGCLLAVAFLPSGFALGQGYVDIAQSRGFTPAALTAMALAGALAICSIVLAADAD